jgi:quercetin dioxygenase-like cupin family protein
VEPRPVTARAAGASSKVPASAGRRHSGNACVSPRVRHVVGFHVVRPDELDWEEYTNYPGRHRAALTDGAGLRHTRANLIPQAAGAIGPRHVERAQDETFVPLLGMLTMYLGEPPVRHELPVGAIAHVEAGTAQQMVNETDEDVLVFVYGAPPAQAGADVIDSAV